MHLPPQIGSKINKTKKLYQIQINNQSWDLVRYLFIYLELV